MNDSQGNEINTGNILFYTERPFSNYADSLCEVYDDSGEQFVCHLVSNGFGKYQSVGRGGNDLSLDAYGVNGLLQQTNTAKDLTLIPNLSVEQATVEYANKHYPLGEPS